MPEMAALCGRRFRVARRVVKTCYYGEGSGIRRFSSDDVVILDAPRCDGTAHDDCQKDCNVFWKESWLRKVDEDGPGTPVSTQQRQLLLSKLRVKSAPDRYFCQSSEILAATEPLSPSQRILTCIKDIRAGNSGLVEMLSRIAIWSFWKARKILFGAYGHGTSSNTPTAALDLHPNELVQVKSIQEISRTLDEKSHNRGLYFTPGMGASCGQQHRVARKLERIIVDGTGKMRKLKNTVYLEGSMCACNHVAFGGCPRGEFSYWREIWLRRTEEPVCSPTHSRPETTAVKS